MKFAVFALLLLCSLFSCDCAHVVDVRYTNIDPKMMLEKIEPLTWDLVADYGGGRVGRCLAVPVLLEKNKVMLLTAQHCVEPLPKKIAAKPIRDGNRSYRYFKIYKTSKLLDLALLEPLSKMLVKVAEPASYPPRVHDPYYQLRYENTKRINLVFYSGHVTNINYARPPLGSYELSGIVPVGTSGGPVFNMRGRLICIQTHTLFCTSWTDILRWVLLIQKS